MTSINMQGTDVNMRQRNNYFDFLRAVAIIMIIGNHTCSVADLSVPRGLGNLAVLQILKSGVPIFLAISGYFLSRISFTDSKSYFQFLYKHLKHIYIPMIIFSLPFIFGNGLCIRSIIGRFMLTMLGAYSVYYFIFLIAQYYILLPFLKRWSRNKRGLTVCGFISAISITLVTYFHSVLGMDLPLFIYAGAFPIWIFFFAFGCYLSYNETKGTIFSAFLLVLTLGLSIAESYWLETYYTAGTGIKLSVFMLSGVIIYILFSDKFQSKYNQCHSWMACLFNKIGRLSFTIYLCHVYVINFLNSQNALTHNWYVNWTIITIISVALVWLIDKILPKKIGKYIGL